MHTKVFKSGNSQAVRLPKQFQFSSNEVEIFRRGDEIILREIPKNLSQAFQLLGELGKDLEEPKDTPPQKRDFE
jgi:antitoxin VapB